MKNYVMLFEEFSISEDSTNNFPKVYTNPGAIGHDIVQKSYGQYLDRSQSMTNFSIGDEIMCCDSSCPYFGKTGKIVAFEDATIRWREKNSSTGVGLNSIEYRCYPNQVKKI